MAPQMARPRSQQLGGSGESRALIKRGLPASRSVAPPSAVCDLGASSGFLDAERSLATAFLPGVEFGPHGHLQAASDLLLPNALQAVGQSRALGGNLPCLLSSNNSIPCNRRLSSSGHKSASALAWNVKALSEKYGLERLGFLTLTFADHVDNARISQKRFNSFATNVLRQRYTDYIRVLERTRTQRIHYHLLVTLQCDIRTGFDFAAIESGDYRSASPALRDEWRWLRETLGGYGFGFHQLHPIKSTSDGIAKYVGKYIGKHLEVRRNSDKGVRLVEYSRGARIANTRHAGVGAGARNWRARVRVFAGMMADSTGLGCNGIADLSKLLGPRWAYHYRDLIDSLPGVA